MNGYSWTEEITTARSEISDAYYKVIKKYPVYEKEVIIGGFSAGAVAALDISLLNAIPVKGFISLCPGKSESVTKP